MRFYLLTFLLLVVKLANSQVQRKIDSLEHLIPQLKGNDSLRLEVLMRLGSIYMNRDVHKGLHFAKLAVEEAKKSNNQKFLMNSYNSLGIIYGSSGNQDSALWAFKKRLEIAEKTNNLKSVYGVLINIGITYDYMSKSKEAINYYYRSLDIAEKLNLPRQAVYGSIASSYRYLGEYKTALHYDSMALREAELRHENEDVKSLLLGNMASGLARLNKLKEAKEILLKCIAYRKSKNEKFYLANHYKSISEIYLSEKDYARAFESSYESVKLNKEVGNLGDVATGYGYLAKIDVYINQLSSAKKYALRSLEMADSLKMMSAKLYACQILSKITSFERNLTLSSHYDSLAAMLNDSINVKSQAEAMADIKTKYETEKKEQENELLKVTQLKNEAALTSQRFAIVLIGVVLMAVLILLFVIYRSRQLFKRTNELLNAKNLAIEAQQEEIVTQNELIARQLDELRRAQAQLIHSEKMASLGQMTSGIAHEINNPLNFISGGAEALKFSMEQLVMFSKESEKANLQEINELEGEVKYLIDSIINGVHRASRIILSLRTFSSPQESGFATVDITEIIDTTFTMLNSKILRNKIEVTKTYPEKIKPVSAIASELSQVFSNIVDNAIQSMETSNEKKLNVIIESTEQTLIVKVRDTGHGIPREIQSKIMEPFFTTKEVGKGTGLGLSISYSIIEKHKGKLTFESEEGKGTEFTIELDATTIF